MLGARIPPVRPSGRQLVIVSPIGQGLTHRLR